MQVIAFRNITFDIYFNLYTCIDHIHTTCAKTILSLLIWHNILIIVLCVLLARPYSPDRFYLKKGRLKPVAFRSWNSNIHPHFYWFIRLVFGNHQISREYNHWCRYIRKENVYKTDTDNIITLYNSYIKTGCIFGRRRIRIRCNAGYNAASNVSNL